MLEKALALQNEMLRERNAKVVGEEIY